MESFLEIFFGILIVMGVLSLPGNKKEEETPEVKAKNDAVNDQAEALRREWIRKAKIIDDTVVKGPMNDALHLQLTEVMMEKISRLLR